MGLASPAGQRRIGRGAFGAEGLENGQEQRAIGGHHQGVLLGHRVVRIAETLGSE